MPEKRLLIIYDVAHPFVKGGGQLRFYEVAQKLISQGWQVDWLTFKTWEGDKSVTCDGINYIGIPGYGGLYDAAGRRKKTEPIVFTFQLMRYLHKIAGYKTVWTAQWPVLHLLPLALASKARGAHLVVDWWEFWGRSTWLGYSRSVGWIGWILENLLLKAITRIGTIVCISNTGLQKISAVVRDRDKVVMIPNGVNLPSDPEQSKRTEETPYDVASLGRLVGHKNFDLIIGSLAILRDQHDIHAKLAVVGDGPMRETLEKQAANLGVSESITFFGRVAETEQCFEILRKSKMFVSGGTKEGGSSIAVLEAYMNGLPVLAFRSENGIEPGLVDHGDTGLFIEPISSPALAKGIAELLKDEAKLQKMSNAALKKSEDFDWRTNAQKYSNVFEGAN